MIATVTDVARVRPRTFQFRLGTLLIAMAWVGLVSLALRTPTVLWAVVIAFTVLILVPSTTESPRWTQSRFQIGSSENTPRGMCYIAGAFCR